MKILIVDDHPVFIDGMQVVLQKLSNKACIVGALSIAEALQKLAEHADFDLVLLDLSFPELDGLAFLQRCNAENLCIPVIIVSSEDKAPQIKRALDLGAMGFIPKSYKTAQMLAALGQIFEGEIYIPEHIVSVIEHLPAPWRQSGIPDNAQASGLSKKQFEVLELLVKGYSNQQIAATLFRTEHTVKTHVSALLHLLGASNRSECAQIARQRGLIS